jgi:hypothetical protein
MNMPTIKDWEGVDIQCGDKITIVQTKKEGKHVWIDEGVKYFVVTTFMLTEQEGETIIVLVQYSDGMGLHQRSLEEIIAEMIKESPGSYILCKEGVNDKELMFYQQYFEA